MLKYLFTYPYSIDKDRISKYLQELIQNLNSPGITTEYTSLQEMLQLMLKFYSSCSIPLFNEEFLVDKRECPSSVKMNTTWNTLNSDLSNLFNQQNTIDSSIIVGYNYLLSKKARILDMVKKCSESLTAVSSICKSKNSPVFEISENFDTSSNIDFELTPADQQVSYDPFIGAITLGCNSQESVNSSIVRKVAIKTYWDGVEITEDQLLNSPDISDGKMYGIYGDHGENGIRIGDTLLRHYAIDPAEPDQPEDNTPPTNDQSAEIDKLMHEAYEDWKKAAFMDRNMSYDNWYRSDIGQYFLETITAQVYNKG